MNGLWVRSLVSEEGERDGWHAEPYDVTKQPTERAIGHNEKPCDIGLVHELRDHTFL